MPWLQPPGKQGPGLGGQFAGKAAEKIAADQVAKLGLKAAGTAAFGPLGGVAGEVGGELAGPLAGQLVSSFFKDGGKVEKKSQVYGIRLLSKIAGDFSKRSQSYSVIKPKQQMPKYRAIGGMTPGPLGLPDMVVAGKGKDISAVKMKKTMGDMAEEVELNYHPPLAPKPAKGE